MRWRRDNRIEPGSAWCSIDGHTLTKRPLKETEDRVKNRNFDESVETSRKDFILSLLPAEKLTEETGQEKEQAGVQSEKQEWK